MISVERNPPADPSSGTGKEWQLLVVLAGVQFTHILDFMVMMPLGPQFMRLFAISPREFGLLVSSYTLTAAAASFLATFQLDRYDRKRALLVLYGGFSVATLLCALAPGYSTLLIARAAAGACGGILNAVIHSIIGDLIPEHRRGSATGTVMMSFSMAAVMGVPLGLAIANLASWRATFVMVALISVAIWCAAWRVLPRIATHIDGGPRRHWMATLTDVLRPSNHRRSLALTGTLLLGGFSVIPFISPYLVGNVGILEKQLPYVYFAGGLATLVTSRLIGAMADRFGKRRMFFVVAALSIIPILLITRLPPLPLALTLITTTLFFILVSGRFIPAMALINSAVDPAQRGSVMSLNASVQSLCSALAAFGGGLVIQKAADGRLQHYSWVGAFAVLSTLTAIYISRKIVAKGEERSA